MVSEERLFEAWNGHASHDNPKLLKLQLIADFRPPAVDQLEEHWIRE